MWEAPLGGDQFGALPPWRRPQGGGYRSNCTMSLHEHPPFFSSWRKAYVFAIVLFAVEVALLYAFTLRFS
jgi:hypothetical protein